jgi:hypothetical protein
VSGTGPRLGKTKRSNRAVALALGAYIVLPVATARVLLSLTSDQVQNGLLHLIVISE